MRAFILLLLGILCTSISYAEEHEPDGHEAPAIFFLVDTSGSMEFREGFLQVEFEYKLNKIRESNSDTEISVTYFRAPTGDACWNSIPIEKALPASEVYLKFPYIYADDSSPLGPALEAAILAAGNNEAEIYLFSDEEQTLGCGIDICDVAKKYLPRKNIRVHSVPIAPDKSDHDKLGCIAAFQAKHAAPIGDQSADTTGTTTGADEAEGNGASNSPTFGDLTAIFFEKWMWMLALIFLSFSSFGFGWRRSSQAHNLENKIKDARIIRGRIIEGDPEAKVKLEELIEEQQENDYLLKPDKSASTWEKSCYLAGKIVASRFWILLFASMGFLFVSLLTVFPENWNVLGAKMSAARKSGWNVLNSDFSAAFAITWIALVFYAGKQVQRRQEAKNELAFVTDEAKRAKKRAQDKELEAEIKRLKNLSQKFKQTISTKPRIVIADEPEAEVTSKVLFDAIEEKAKRRLLPDEKDYESADSARSSFMSLDIIWKESIISTPLLLRTEFNFQKFLNALLENGYFDGDQRSLWAEFVQQLKTPNNQAILRAARKLSQALNIP